MNETIAAPGWVSENAGLLTLQRPESWEQQNAADLDFADVDYIARLSESASPFRMNVVVTHTLSSASIEEASSHVIAAAYEQHPGALVVGCDIWTAASFPGRRIEFSYPAGNVSIIVTRWVFATGLHQIHLVASRSSEEFILSDEIFSWMASSLTFSEDA